MKRSVILPFLLILTGLVANPVHVNDLLSRAISSASLLIGVATAQAETVTTMAVPGITFWTDPDSAEYQNLGVAEKMDSASTSTGAQNAGTRIRFMATVSCKAELAYGSWKKDNDGGLLFVRQKSLFTGDVSAGQVYEFVAPICRSTEESHYFLRFTNNSDESTAEWYLQDEGFGGRAGQNVFSIEFAAG